MDRRIYTDEKELSELLSKGRQNAKSMADVIQNLEGIDDAILISDQKLLNEYAKELIIRFADEDTKNRLLQSFGVHPDYPMSKYSSKPVMRIQYAIDHGLVEEKSPPSELGKGRIDSLDKMLRNKEIPLIERMSSSIIRHLEKNEWQPLGILDDIKKRKKAFLAEQKSAKIAANLKKAEKEEQLKIQKKAEWLFTKWSILTLILLAVALITILFVYPGIMK